MKSKKIIAGLLVAFFLFLQGCGSKSQQSARFQDLGNGICHDTVAGLMWQKEKSPTIKSFAEAQLYVKSLNLGGYTDWRLPTVYELYDLNYLFDLHLNGNCNLDREGKYWSGEKDGEGLAGAWEISDQCDPERKYYPGTHGAVRAVRP